MISLERYNETYIKIHCSDDIAQELSDYFTFEVPGARFIPAVRKKSCLLSTSDAADTSTSCIIGACCWPQIANHIKKIKRLIMDI